jgi:hypothetical protein
LLYPIERRKACMFLLSQGDGAKHRENAYHEHPGIRAHGSSLHA